MKNLPDEVLLRDMSSAYEVARIDSEMEIEGPLASVEYDINEDPVRYMMLCIVRVLGNKKLFTDRHMINRLLNLPYSCNVNPENDTADREVCVCITKVLCALADMFKRDGIIDRYTLRATDVPDEYGGINFFKNRCRMLSVEVDWQGPYSGVSIKKLDMGIAYSFSVETVVADKLAAILREDHFTRPQDLLDIYLISECMDFDARLVDYYLLRTVCYVNELLNRFPHTDMDLVEYNKAYDMFSSEYTEVPSPDFGKVYERFCTIVHKVRNTKEQYYWKSRSHWFI
jgi:hypothetical protein